MEAAPAPADESCTAAVMAAAEEEEAEKKDAPPLPQPPQPWLKLRCSGDGRQLRWRAITPSRGATRVESKAGWILPPRRRARPLRCVTWLF